jgi:hypothetical protein
LKQFKDNIFIQQSPPKTVGIFCAKNKCGSRTLQTADEIYVQYVDVFSGFLVVK